MLSLSKTAARLALALTVSLGASPLFAAAKPAAAPPDDFQIVSTLDGKFTFTLPKGYVADALPPGAQAQGTAGANGTMYINQATKSVVVVAQTLRNDGIDLQDNEPQFLDSAVEGFLKDVGTSLPDYKKLAQKKLLIKGVGLRQVDGTAKMGGGKTLNSTFLAGSGNRLLVIQAISRADDVKGHELLVRQITSGK
ncbi:hypothetical protein JTY93_10050 [Pseudomonas hygromyciniae]|uniref:Uncharacterized protein n=1 Tax=Pseudomonas hygromyciniae TaxID=2812000 RepID=A0ABX7K214_9PSED|nr:hypothetical protein [Pseudomonas hygromyciniae]MBN0976633.1 hypothetical protein [Pseudomonas hygromyciniae]QSB41659.1 hypothetical protein JTY93_10050 [Pseudomonas hygromyciniae]